MGDEVNSHGREFPDFLPKTAKNPRGNIQAAKRARSLRQRRDGDEQQRQQQKMNGNFLKFIQERRPNYIQTPSSLYLSLRSLFPHSTKKIKNLFPLPPSLPISLSISRPSISSFSLFLLPAFEISYDILANFHIESIPKDALESVFRLSLILPFLILLPLLFSFSAPENPSPRVSHRRRSFSTGAMKVHPVPKKRSISTIRYDLASLRQKKLRRLPHIFSRVLELPFRSDADVSVEETPESFRFIVTTDDITDDVQAHTIDICPGVTKIVIRGRNVFDMSFAGLELDLWRFRLPSTARPELASAAHVDGDLVVTVPKGAGSDDSDGGDDGNDVEVEGEDGFVEGAGHLVLVQ
ncbi:hypothetical protein ACLOJK_005800 [Asimina triloba]